MTSKNKNLHSSKANKNDEFYTRYNDIAEELKHYTKHFEDKIILCNCDDPEWSKFWLYFETKFESLGLKKLISTHYNMDGSPSYALIFEGEYSEDGSPITTRIELEGSGEFQSEECVEYLKQADIVVTNPPFSIAREEFIPLLIEHDKKFLIIGDDNWITYKSIFKLFQDNKIWKGLNSVKAFTQPDGSEKQFGNKSWFTNLDNDTRHRKIILLQDYNIDDYIVYDNYDAIDIGRYNDKGEWKADIRCIPDFYNGIMGVPITFVNKYCPEQFEIIGLGTSREHYTPNKQYEGLKTHKTNGKVINGAPINSTLAIKVDQAPSKKDYYTDSDGNIYIQPYARVLIKRKDD